MIKVFLVEDEIVVREGIKHSIDWEKNGFEFIGEAGDGELAYPIIVNNNPDIVITDIKMPFMNGLELASLIRNEMPHIKVVILSGYDDFDYAKEAISLGVTEYLLKPISGTQLIESLIGIRDKILEEKRNKEFMEQFHKEIKDNQQIKQYKFFQKLVSSKESYIKLREEGKDLGFDLSAGAYCLALLKIYDDDRDEEEYSDKKVQIEEEILSVFSKSCLIIAFDRMSEGIAFLCMSKDGKLVKEKVKLLINQIIEIISKCKGLTYFLGVGSIQYRLTELDKSFNEASKAFAYRYFLNKNQVIYSDDIRGYQISKEKNFSLEAVDIKNVSRKIIEDFLRSGNEDEIGHFIEEYFKSFTKKSLESLMFRQYIVLDFYFSASLFMEQLAYSPDKILEILGGFQEIHEIITDLNKSKKYLKKIIQKVLYFRSILSKKRYHDVIEDAKKYIIDNYNNEDMSLNLVAASVNFSPNHFSTIFSQETGITFIEHLTQVRIDKAKELLLSTNMRISDIGYEVGYRDSHYFSYLFKKIQGISPKSFRARANL